MHESGPDGGEKRSRWLRAVDSFRRRSRAVEPGSGDGVSPQGTAQVAYKRMVNEFISPTVRGWGLTGSAGRYVLPSDGVWALVGLQKSVYSDVHSIRFTVNLLVVSKAIWAERRPDDASRGRLPSPNMLYGSWAENERLGMLVHGGTDEWWRLGALDDPAAVAKDVLGALRSHGLPWLQQRIKQH